MYVLNDFFYEPNHGCNIYIRKHPSHHKLIEKHAHMWFYYSVFRICNDTTDVRDYVMACYIIT